MGQGVAVTRLQMAMAVGAIANGGVLMRPMLVKRLQDRDGKVVQQYEPQTRPARHQRGNREGNGGGAQNRCVR